MGRQIEPQATKYIYILYKDKEIVCIVNADGAMQMLKEGLGNKKSYELYRYQINQYVSQTKKKITAAVDIYY
jgi:hypothetical protein